MNGFHLLYSELCRLCQQDPFLFCFTHLSITVNNFIYCASGYRKFTTLVTLVFPFCSLIFVSFAMSCLLGALFHKIHIPLKMSSVGVSMLSIVNLYSVSSLYSNQKQVLFESLQRNKLESQGSSDKCPICLPSTVATLSFSSNNLANASPLLASCLNCNCRMNSWISCISNQWISNILHWKKYITQHKEFRKYFRFKTEIFLYFTLLSVIIIHLQHPYNCPSGVDRLLPFLLS